MKILTVQQGTLEWLNARMGLVTASGMKRVITPAKAEPSKQQFDYMALLFAEWFLGQPCDDFSTGYTERGTGMEAEARGHYTLETGRNTRTVGFITNDAGTVGVSPDSLVGDDGLLEIKCPGAVKHAAYLLGAARPDADYHCQLQAQLWITERQWVDVLSYNPAMPSRIIRVERDTPFIAAMQGIVGAFVEQFETIKDIYTPARDEYRARVMARKPGEADPDTFATRPTDLTSTDFGRAAVQAGCD